MARQVVYISTPFPTLDQIAASIGLAPEVRARLDEEVRTRKRVPVSAREIKLKKRNGTARSKR